jgi:superfamily II DNA or RNA helicase
MRSELVRLRDYQNECFEAVWASLAYARERVACVLPTGAGKTVIFAHLARYWSMDRGPVLILVHRDELIRQTLNKLAEAAPWLEVGVIQGQRKELDKRVTVASVQTLSRYPEMAGQLARNFERGKFYVGPLAIVDECHHATAKSYRTALEAYGCFNHHGSRAVGFTATLTRGDNAGLGNVWEEVVFRRDILDMIPDYLCDVTGRTVTVDGMSLAEARVSGGDYTAGSLSDILTSSDAASYAANGWLEHAAGRPGICFVPTVDTAWLFRDAFKAAGIDCGVVWGAQDRDARREALLDARNGDLDVLINCMVLTEGFDWPAAEVCMIARPTTHAGLYVQMAGRALRKAEGKKSALILDLVGLDATLRLATIADLSSRRIREIKPGETLTEAAERERGEGSPFLADYVMGHRDLELFQRSEANWLTTRAGVKFIAPGGDQIVFVWPDGSATEPDRYKVGVRPLNARGGEFRVTGMELDFALAWAEQTAWEINRDNPTARGANLVDRKAPWRSGQASDGMISFAQRLGQGVTTGDRAGRVSDLINIELASRVLDKHLPRPMRGPQS